MSIRRIIVAALLSVGLGSMFVPQLSCQGSSNRSIVFPPPTFVPVTPLTAQQVRDVIEGSTRAVDNPELIVAVVDRLGNILGLWHRNPAATVENLNKAVAIARTGAFLSSSQGPLSSRTLEFISTHHFPSTFADPVPPPISQQVPAITSLPEQRVTTGVGFTPQGPLWQIFSTNRGAQLDSATNPYRPNKVFPRPGAYVDGNSPLAFPGPGLGYLPGGVPLYDTSLRLVGAVACYIPNPTAGDIPEMEFGAFSGAAAPRDASGALTGETFNFPLVDEGGIFLVGILLPYLVHTDRPAGVGPGGPASAGTFQDVDLGGGVADTIDGSVDPFGWYISPIADPNPPAPGIGLTQNEVINIINNCVASADGARAAIRLPIGTPTRMFIAISNLDGIILGAFRMEDAPIFSNDVSITKARNVAYFSAQQAVANGDLIPTDNNPNNLPIALTNRTLGFLTQPTFPPGIDTAPEPGPLFQSLAVQTSNPLFFDNQAGIITAPTDGSDIASNPNESGVVFFPGAAPLYRDGVLIGGIGVSGDGVEEDDFVTAGGAVNTLRDDGELGFEPPTVLRADQYFYSGVRLPYQKFPQLPGGGQ